MQVDGWKVAQLRVQHRLSRSRRLVRTVEERYLRLDVPCPSNACTACGQYRRGPEAILPADVQHCVVPSTETLLHQLDVLASPLMTQPIVLLQSTLEALSQIERPHYYQVMRLLKSAPIFCDCFHKLTHRGISEALLWLSTHLPSVQLTFVRDNDDDVAVHAGLKSVSVHEWVESLHDEQLSDLLARRGALKRSLTGAVIKSSSVYESHWQGEKLDQALRDGTVIRATIRVWASGRFGSCLIRDGIECRLDGMEAINRALNGDEVAVYAVDNESARVVAVLRRAWRPMAGSLMEANEELDLKRTAVWFVPLSAAAPRIKVHTRNVERLVGQRFVVRIDDWPESQRFPSGHVIQVLGSIGDQGVESAALLVEFGVRDEPFTDDVMQRCPPIDWRVTDADCAGRLDLRSTRVFSIDPPGCTDIDDALHVTRLGNGLFQVGVHIADVSYFVKEDDPIDREALARGTSVYLVDRRIDMIPPRLSTLICSLRDNVDRLAFSCIWTMDADANVVDTKFTKSVIRSHAALAYADAQKHIDDQAAAANDHKADSSGSIGRDCRDLNQLARKLRQRRIDAGALTLASPEVRFELDRGGKNGVDGADLGRIQETRPLDIELYEIKQANQLVEEFMLLANIAVAQHIVTCYPGRALLRRHPAPSHDNLNRLVDAANSAGHHLEVGSSRALADSLDRVAESKSDPAFDNALRIFATRCMNQAVYFCSGSVPPGSYQHYGLAASLYTHFTSPIRRYADLVVHRLLSASLQLEDVPSICQHKSTLNTVASSLNRLNRAAQGVGRASVDLFTLCYFDNRVVEATGVVMDVRVDGLSVFVKQFGIEAKIDLLREVRQAHKSVECDEEQEPITDLDLSREAGFVYEEASRTLTTPKLGSFSMFAPVRVKIQVDHRKHGRRNLVLEIIGRTAEGGIVSDRPRKRSRKVE